MQRKPPFRSKKYLDRVRNLPCKVNSPVCQYTGIPESEPAHSNLGEDGKGKGIKACDSMVAAACKPCHLWLDGSAPKEERQWYHDRAIKRTIRALIGDVLVVK